MVHRWRSEDNQQRFSPSIRSAHIIWPTAALLALKAEERAIRMGREERELSPQGSRQEGVAGRDCALTTCPLCLEAVGTNSSCHKSL